MIIASRLCLFFLLAVAQSWSLFALPNSMSSEEIGVRHVQLPGQISSNSTKVTVVLHMFIARPKRRRASGGCYIKGYLFAEAVSRLACFVLMECVLLLYRVPDT
jgi:hypothetical protein